MNRKATWVDLVIALTISLFTIHGIVASWHQQNWLGLVFSALGTIFFVFFIGNALRQGLRTPDRLERFELRALLVAGLVAVGGLLLLLLAWQYWLFPATAGASPAVRVVLVMVPLFVWLLATLAALRRVRDRSETAAAYRRRVGLPDDEP